MRITFSIFAIALALSFWSCGGGGSEHGGEHDGQDTTASESAAINVGTGEMLPLDLEASVVKWKGAKVTGDSHNGIVKIQEGAVMVDENGNLSGGEFTIDLNTIESEDLKPGEGKEKLEGHLKAEDFFHVAEHPTAMFKITGLEKTGPDQYNVTGDLTVRGQTHSIDFPATVTVNGKAVNATADFKFDRTKYGIEFHSKQDADWWDEGKAELKDQVINNEIELMIDLKSKPQA